MPARRAAPRGATRRRAALLCVAVAVLLALLSSALWGTADFLGGTVARRLPVLSVILVSQAAALAALLPLAAVTGGFPSLDAGLVPGLLAGVAGLGALAAFYRALAIGTMGVVAPVAALGVVVPVAVGLVQGEAPSRAQVAGIAVAVVGVVLASGPELSGEGRGGTRSLVLALLAALGFGLVLVLLAEGSGGDEGGVGDVLGTLLAMRVASVALLLAVGAVLLARGGPTGARVTRSDLLGLLVIGLFDVGANGTFALASQGDLLSVTAVLASLYPVVTALLARQLHGERLAGVQVGGVVLALGGVVLLAGG